MVLFFYSIGWTTSFYNLPFENSIKNNEYSFPIDQIIMNSYFFIDPDEPTYLKICNKLIEVFNTDNYMLPKLNKTQKISLFQKVRNYVYRIRTTITKKFNINIGIFDFLKRIMRLDDYDDSISYNSEMVVKNYTSKEELIKIHEKLAILLKNQNDGGLPNEANISDGS